MVAAAIGVAFYFITEPFFGGELYYFRTFKVEEYFYIGDATQFGFGAFIICSVVLHIKPELMGKLNKTDDEEENPSDPHETT